MGAAQMRNVAWSLCVGNCAFSWQIRANTHTHTRNHIYLGTDFAASTSAGFASSVAANACHCWYKERTTKFNWFYRKATASWTTHNGCHRLLYLRLLIILLLLLDFIAAATTYEFICGSATVMEMFSISFSNFRNLLQVKVGCKLRVLTSRTAVDNKNNKKKNENAVECL